MLDAIPLVTQRLAGPYDEKIWAAGFIFFSRVVKALSNCSAHILLLANAGMQPVTLKALAAAVAGRRVPLHRVLSLLVVFLFCSVFHAGVRFSGAVSSEDAVCSGLHVVVLVK